VEFLWGTWSPSWDYPDERIEHVKETFRTGDTVEHALAYYRQIVGAGLRSMVSLDQPKVDDEPHISVPTLLVAGAEDGCIGPDLFADVEGAFADGTEVRVVSVPGAGHFMHQERPDAVGEAVVDFLSD
jgi:pimeloyl-ACP methyl ester carboxylesterase